ncbi:hypothetical protein GUJ93_ZPchr0002g24887 [Zizania palustris]|uniref:Uncharacterized protein n=1 Tax=Zizania palustris TaxID=103762 RepID=A0A8J5S2J8_ZIZPA|nr:hypothetical protein GUJ93_ZPchr0002g24887 [Zizania palustris]
MALTSSLAILPATEILKPNFFVGESSSASPHEEIRSLDGLGACGEQAWEDNLQDGRARAGLIGPDFSSLQGGPTAHSLSSVRATDGSNVIVKDAGDKGKEKLDDSSRGDAFNQGLEDSEHGGTEAGTTSEAHQYKHASAPEEDNSNSDKDGKVDILEFLEDLSDEEGERMNETSEGLEASENIKDNQTIIANVEDNMGKSSKVDVPEQGDNWVDHKGDLPQMGRAAQGSQDMSTKIPEEHVDDANKGVHKKRTKHHKFPPVAQRFSARIKRDGIPIQLKAQQRAGQLNDISGWALRNLSVKDVTCRQAELVRPGPPPAGMGHCSSLTADHSEHL